jgi:hypothetical protein
MKSLTSRRNFLSLSRTGQDYLLRPSSLADPCGADSPPPGTWNVLESREAASGSGKFPLLPAPESNINTSRALNGGL